MIDFILLCLGIYWVATNPSTAAWVVAGILALIFICALAEGKNKKKQPARFSEGAGFGGRAHGAAAGERPRIRIDHPHLVGGDDYECGICGRRFTGDQMSCPYCGVRFTGREENCEEFYEEEDEWDAWDEEEGL